MNTTDLNKHCFSPETTVVRDFMQNAIDREGTVWVKYRAENGEITEREFQPQEVQVTRSSVRTVGVCKLRNEVRTLLSKGILEIAKQKPEVTYKLGDRFLINGNEKLLSRIGPSTLAFVDIKNGYAWTWGESVTNLQEISQGTIDRLACGFKAIKV